MRSRRVFFGVALLAVVVIGAWLLFRMQADGPRAETMDAGDRRPAVAPPAPLAAGASSRGEPKPRGAESEAPDATRTESAPATAPPSKSAIVARDDADAPVAGAKVHARPKIAKEDESLREIGHTDAIGRWPVPEKGLAGRWIAVTARGLVPAVLDGDRLDAKGDTVARLAAGGDVEVIVTEADDRTPVAKAGASVEIAREAGSGADQPLKRELSAYEMDWLVRASAETADDGRAVVAIGAAGRVRVEVRGSNWNTYTDPEFVELPRPSGTARFRLLAGCRLVIHAIDDATGAPLAVAFEVRHGLEGTDPDRFVGGFTSNPEKTGVFDLFPGLHPGLYRVRVGANGYEAWNSTPVVLDKPGASAVVEARMKRATAVPRRGAIRLALGRPATQGSPWHSEPGSKSPSVLLRRTSPDENEWGSVVGRPPLGMSIEPSAIRAGAVRWDADRRVLEIPDLDPARYAVAVFDRATWTVGGIADLEVLPDSTTERSVDLVPGVRVRIADLAADGAAIRRLRLVDERGTSWPAVAMGPEWESTYSGDFGPSSGTVLLPVPAARVRVTWRGPDGTEHERTLPEAK